MSAIDICICRDEGCLPPQPRPHRRRAPPLCQWDSEPTIQSCHEWCSWRQVPGVQNIWCRVDLRVLSIVVNIIATQTFDRMVCILCYWMWIGAGGSSVTSASPRARLLISQPRPPALSAACSGARPSPAPRSTQSCQPTLPGSWPRQWMDVDTAIYGIGTLTKHLADFVTVTY